MAKQHITYSFSGYRYAPENFRASKRICGGALVDSGLLTLRQIQIAHGAPLVRGKRNLATRRLLRK